MFEAIILGMLQGLTEFLPVSSTAHLVLCRWFLGWEGNIGSLAFDVSLHAGTLTSILICLRKEILESLAFNRRLWVYIILGTIPAGVAGILFEDAVEHSLRTPGVIALALAGFGYFMYVSERYSKAREFGGVTLRDALIIGLAQAVALVPGVSRSGITIGTAMMLGFARPDAARFSFLLSIPAVAGAAVLESRGLFGGGFGGGDASLFIAGFAASMVSGIAAIRFMLKYLERHTVNLFVYYRFGLAVIITVWMLSKA